MKVKFKTNELEYFYTTPLDEIKGKLPFQKDVIKQFKRKMQILLSIQHLEELNQFKSLNFEFLKGDRRGECSIRLNRTYRLLFIPMNEQHDDLIVEIILINEISKHYQK